MAQSNARTTVGALLGTVTTTAHTVSNTLDAANTSVSMLNKLVNDAAARQAKRSLTDMAKFEATLVQETAKELADSRMQIKKYCAQSEDHAETYETAYNELAAILNPPTP